MYFCRFLRQLLPLLTMFRPREVTSVDFFRLPCCSPSMSCCCLAADKDIGGDMKVLSNPKGFRISRGQHRILKQDDVFQPGHVWRNICPKITHRVCKDTSCRRWRLTDLQQYRASASRCVLPIIPSEAAYLEGLSLYLRAGWDPDGAYGQVDLFRQEHNTHCYMYHCSGMYQ